MTVRSEAPAERAPGVLALFPGGLGDFLCCWPALEALRLTTHARLTLAARPAWLDLLPDDAVATWSVDRREIADLFSTAALSPNTVALFDGFARVESWTGYGDALFARRLRDAARGAQVAVHPFRALQPGEHAAHYYARCLGVSPAITTLPLRPAAVEWTEALWRQHGLGMRVLAVHPGSGSPRKNWQGMYETANAWRRAVGGSVVVLGGPAESRGELQRGSALTLRNEPLDRIAAVLARAGSYLGNDSGISHLAGLVGARGVVLFGPTDPVSWRPLGSGLHLLSRPEPCLACGDAFCTHRLQAADVLAALRSIDTGV